MSVSTMAAENESLRLRITELSPFEEENKKLRLRIGELERQLAVRSDSNDDELLRRIAELERQLVARGDTGEVEVNSLDELKQLRPVVCCHYKQSSDIHMASIGDFTFHRCPFRF